MLGENARRIIPHKRASCFLGARRGLTAQAKISFPLLNLRIIKKYTRRRWLI